MPDTKDITVKEQSAKPAPAAPRQRIRRNADGTPFSPQAMVVPAPMLGKNALGQDVNDRGQAVDADGDRIWPDNTKMEPYEIGVHEYFDNTHPHDIRPSVDLHKTLTPGLHHVVLTYPDDTVVHALLIDGDDDYGPVLLKGAV